MKDLSILYAILLSQTFLWTCNDAISHRRQYEESSAHASAHRASLHPLRKEARYDDLIKDGWYRFLEESMEDFSMKMPTSLPSPSRLPTIPPSTIQSLLPTASPTKISAPSMLPQPSITTLAPTPIQSTSSSSPSPSMNSLPVISSWKQVGQSIAGSMVVLSANADTMAVEIRTRENSMDRVVAVQVFRLVNATTWLQQGTDILGPPLASDDNFMTLVSIALSADGSRLAMSTRSGRNSLEGGTRQFRGLVQVFQWSGDSWGQIGQDLSGDPQDEFGFSVSLSSDGSIVAAGAPFAPNRRGAGFVRILRFDSNSSLWVSFGQILNGTSTEEDSGFGYSLELSRSGTTLVVGAPFNAPGGQLWAGRVHAFWYNVSEERWQPMGQTIEGTTRLDHFGLKVAISGDGKTIAGAAISSVGQPRGLVRVYRFKDGTDSFEQIGSALVGEAEAYIFGEDLALSANGNIVAIGDTQFATEDTGYVRVMGYDGTDWELLGPLLTGGPEVQSFGVSVALADDATFVGAGWRTVNEDMYVGAYESIV